MASSRLVLRDHVRRNTVGPVRPGAGQRSMTSVSTEEIAMLPVTLASLESTNVKRDSTTVRKTWPLTRTTARSLGARDLADRASAATPLPFYGRAACTTDSRYCGLLTDGMLLEFRFNPSEENTKPKLESAIKILVE